jgi:molybdopterin/thiamine biosynthesis adenylyltransferase
MDLIRQEGLFDPLTIGKVLIIGAGATGSAMAWEMAKCGVPHIQVMDKDVVEAHNIPNQMYGQPDIGKPKVEALQELIHTQTGTKIKAIQEFFTKTGYTDSIEVVIICIDHMDDEAGRAGRKFIVREFEVSSCTRMIVDIRIGVDTINIICVDPFLKHEMDDYYESLFPDSDIPEPNQNVCKHARSRTIGPIARMAASMAMFKITQFHRGERKQRSVIGHFGNQWNLVYEET